MGPEDLLVFGGTFDPVHNGHLIVARAVAEQRGFGRVVLIPAAAPPHKPGPAATGPQRLEMLQAAIAGEALFEVRDLELQRSGPSYTIDTVNALQEGAGNALRIHLLIGTDMLRELPSWHRVAELLDRAEILTALRRSDSAEPDDPLAALEGAFSAEQLSRLRAGLAATPRVDISSTEVRQRVRAGWSVRYFVPDAVADLIAAHGLYGRTEKPENNRK